MELVKMKIVSFDELTGAFHIKFASDESEKEIDEYPAHLFSVLELRENISINEILTALAQEGHKVLIQQNLAEEIARNNSKTEQYKMLVGTDIEYNVDTLFNQEFPSPNQPISTGLMVI
jgi:hypothetical protein